MNPGSDANNGIEVKLVLDEEKSAVELWIEALSNPDPKRAQQILANPKAKAKIPGRYLEHLRKTAEFKENKGFSTTPKESKTVPADMSFQYQSPDHAKTIRFLLTDLQDEKNFLRQLIFAMFGYDNDKKPYTVRFYPELLPFLLLKASTYPSLREGIAKTALYHPQALETILHCDDDSIVQSFLDSAMHSSSILANERIKALIKPKNFNWQLAREYIDNLATQVPPADENQLQQRTADLVMIACKFNSLGWVIYQKPELQPYVQRFTLQQEENIALNNLGVARLFKQQGKIKNDSFGKRIISQHYSLIDDEFLSDTCSDIEFIVKLCLDHHGIARKIFLDNKFKSTFNLLNPTQFSTVILKYRNLALEFFAREDTAEYILKLPFEAIRSICYRYPDIAQLIRTEQRFEKLAANSLDDSKQDLRCIAWNEDNHIDQPKTVICPDDSFYHFVQNILTKLFFNDVNSSGNCAGFVIDFLRWCSKHSEGNYLNYAFKLQKLTIHGKKLLGFCNFVDRIHFFQENQFAYKKSGTPYYLNEFTHHTFVVLAKNILTELKYFPYLYLGTGEHALGLVKHPITGKVTLFDPVFGLKSFNLPEEFEQFVNLFENCLDWASSRTDQMIVNVYRVSHETALKPRALRRPVGLVTSLATPEKPYEAKQETKLYSAPIEEIINALIKRDYDQAWLLINNLKDKSLDMKESLIANNAKLLIFAVKSDLGMAYYNLRQGLPVDCNFSDSRGDTLLHRAIMAKHPHLDLIKLLIKHGADIFKRNFLGHTPLFLALASKILPNIILPEGVKIDKLEQLLQIVELSKDNKLELPHKIIELFFKNYLAIIENLSPKEINIDQLETIIDSFILRYKSKRFSHILFLQLEENLTGLLAKSSGYLADILYVKHLEIQLCLIEYYSKHVPEANDRLAYKYLEKSQEVDKTETKSVDPQNLQEKNKRKIIASLVVKLFKEARPVIDDPPRYLGRKIISFATSSLEYLQVDVSREYAEAMRDILICVFFSPLQKINDRTSSVYQALTANLALLFLGVSNIRHFSLDKDKILHILNFWLTNAKDPESIKPWISTFWDLLRVCAEKSENFDVVFIACLYKKEPVFELSWAFITRLINMCDPKSVLIPLIARTRRLDLKKDAAVWLQCQQYLFGNLQNTTITLDELVISFSDTNNDFCLDFFHFLNKQNLEIPLSSANTEQKQLLAIEIKGSVSPAALPKKYTAYDYLLACIKYNKISADYVFEKLLGSVPGEIHGEIFVACLAQYKSISSKTKQKIADFIVKNKNVSHLFEWLFARHKCEEDFTADLFVLFTQKTICPETILQFAPSDPQKETFLIKIQTQWELFKEMIEWLEKQNPPQAKTSQASQQHQKVLEDLFCSSFQSYTLPRVETKSNNPYQETKGDTPQNDAALLFSKMETMHLLICKTMRGTQQTDAVVGNHLTHLLKQCAFKGFENYWSKHKGPQEVELDLLDIAACSQIFTLHTGTSANSYFYQKIGGNTRTVYEGIKQLYERLQFSINTQVESYVTQKYRSIISTNDLLNANRLVIMKLRIEIGIEKCSKLFSNSRKIKQLTLEVEAFQKLNLIQHLENLKSNIPLIWDTLKSMLDKNLNNHKMLLLYCNFMKKFLPQDHQDRQPQFLKPSL